MKRGKAMSTDAKYIAAIAAIFVVSMLLYVWVNGGFSSDKLTSKELYAKQQNVRDYLEDNDDILFDFLDIIEYYDDTSPVL